MGPAAMSTDHAKDAFASKVAAAWPAADWRDTNVLLAVSGGPDSVALLRAVHSLKQRAGGRGELFVGHLNHGMRGKEAEADQTWLAELCDQLELPLTTSHADVAGLAAEQGDGWESAARAARYDFLRTTAERVGARWVATGHTRADQVETVVHRLIRGTGLAGLAGMRRARPLSLTTTLVRPMLAIRRAEVLTYLSAIGQDFRTDATNADVRFTRNRLRQRLLPLLRTEFNADFDETIVRLAEQATESQQVIDWHAAELVLKCVHIDWRPPDRTDEKRQHVGAESTEAESVRIDCRPLAGLPPLIVREVCRAAWCDANWPLQAMGFDEWQRLAVLAMGDDDRPQISLPGNIRAGRKDEALVLTKADATGQAVSTTA
jgi:tRNA(Ile)-lysidine synthase